VTPIRTSSSSTHPQTPPVSYARSALRPPLAGRTPPPPFASAAPARVERRSALRPPLTGWTLPAPLASTAPTRGARPRRTDTARPRRPCSRDGLRLRHSPACPRPRLPSRTCSIRLPRSLPRPVPPTSSAPTTSLHFVALSSALARAPQG
jgi:hypothetical protein